MKKVSIGIVGAGFAARYHVSCLRRVFGADVDICGVYSPREESRRSFAAAHGTQAIETVEELVQKADVVDICSPPYVHSAVILQAASQGKGVICEKPLTGYFGPPGAKEAYRGDTDEKARMLDSVVGDLMRIREAVTRHGVFFGYAENFISAPSIQKEREIIERTSAQILRMTGEESHNGSASPFYGIWRYSGGGSLIGKGVHPLAAMLYLKRIEGLTRTGKPIRPLTVTSRVHQITRLPSYQDRRFIRTDYHDVEDYGFIHLVFEDGTVADVLTSEVVLGGIQDHVEVFANNHRTHCAISPVELCQTYNPGDEAFKDVYLVEKCSTQQGWSSAAPDENLTMGYQAEFQDFVDAFVNGHQPQSDLALAIDTTAATYAAYLSAEKKGMEVAIPLL